MALPRLAEVIDLAAWPGVVIDTDQTAQAEAVLSAASAFARGEAGQNWVDANGDLLEVPADVVSVVVQAAARVWTNPEGVTARGVDGVSESFGRSIADGLYFTALERRTLARYRNSGRSGLWTQGTTRGGYDIPPEDYFLRDQNNGDPILYGPDPGVI